MIIIITVERYVSYGKKVYNFGGWTEFSCSKKQKKEMFLIEREVIG